MEGIGLAIIIYMLFCVCVIFPPTEFISAGLTLESVFSSVLGDESIHFVDYHIKRTCLALFAHSCLPLGFFLTIEFFAPEVPGISAIFTGDTVPIFWRLILYFCILLPIGVASIIFYWRHDNWSSHPTAKLLSLYDTDNWHNVVTSIETEYRRLDKFTALLGGVKRLVVTDSWILYVDLYQFKLAHQSDARLTIVNSDEHNISHLSETQVQLLTILVENIVKPITPFTFRLNSLNYRELRNKLRTPIDTARDIVIHMSLDDQFVQAFRDHAINNPPFDLSDAQKDLLEPCIGCMHERANVKLEKLCTDVGEQEYDEEGQAIPHCRQCYCRPMWCLSCMGRWFASRQNARRPDQWLGGKAPCPTCRTIFCIFDVCLVE